MALIAIRVHVIKARCSFESMVRYQHLIYLSLLYQLYEVGEDVCIILHIYFKCLTK